MVNGAGQHPSPIKTTKKLSLSDYKAARMKKSDTFGMNKTSSGTSPIVTPFLSAVEEAKALGSLEGSAVIDSLMVEKAADRLGPVVSLTSDLASNHDRPPEKSNGTL